MKGTVLWTIDNFSELDITNRVRPIKGHSYEVGGASWRLTASAPRAHFSVFLEASDPSVWVRATFVLRLVNQLDPARSVCKHGAHTFTTQELRFGFPQLLPLTELLNSRNGFLVNDTLKLEADLTVPEEPRVLRVWPPPPWPTPEAAVPPPQPSTAPLPVDAQPAPAALAELTHLRGAVAAAGLAVTQLEFGAAASRAAAAAAESRRRLLEGDAASLACLDASSLQGLSDELHVTLGRVGEALALARATEAAVKAAEAQRTTCFICEERPRDTALSPCGHAVFCWQCAGRAEAAAACPICRAAVVTRLRLFV